MVFIFMNLKSNLRKNLAIVVVIMLFACFNFFLGFHFRDELKNKILGINLTEIHSEISPNGLKEIILYRKPFIGNNREEYRNYLAHQHIFTVRELDPWGENDLFLGDERVGYPHWLGNDFIFFTTSCGTGCRGLKLINVNSGRFMNATLTTTPVTKDGYETDFRDWFGRKYKFPGWDKNLRSVDINGDTYLIFEMWNNNQSIGGKSFLFTGTLLKEL